jgi:hypothetical protein
MTNTETYLTLQEVIRAHEDAGGHFFDADTKRFFRSRIGDRTYCGPGGIYFTTSEQFVGSGGYVAPRRYSVRRFDAENPRSIDDVGGFQAYATAATARAAALRAASGRCGHDGCHVPRSRFDTNGLPTCGNHETDKGEP